MLVRPGTSQSLLRFKWKLLKRASPPLIVSLTVWISQGLAGCMSFETLTQRRYSRAREGRGAQWEGSLPRGRLQTHERVLRRTVGEEGVTPQHILPFAFCYFRTDKRVLTLQFCSTTGPTVVWLKLYLSAVIASHMSLLPFATKKSRARWNLAGNSLFRVPENLSNSHLADLYNWQFSPKTWQSHPTSQQRFLQLVLWAISY